jgi:hypothetical protein
MMEGVHRVSAAFVFAFLCLHFANHLIGLEGDAAQLQFLAAARLVYRNPIVEALLALAFTIQLGTGAVLIREIWIKRKDFVHQLLAASGLVLILFVLGHAAWLAVARLYLNVDTDFDYVRQGLASPQWRSAFLGFYGAGVFALFLHMGCILHGVFKKTNKPAGYALLTVTTIAGGYVTGLLLTLYGGQPLPG